MLLFLLFDKFLDTLTFYILQFLVFIPKTILIKPPYMKLVGNTSACQNREITIVVNIFV